jgi:ParB-like chromosome segregation protein Spo0J
MAESVHLSRRHLLRMQQLAEMPDVVIAMVRDRRLTPSHAYQLARLSDSERQARLAQEAVAGGWSVQSLAEAIRSTENPKAKGQRCFKDHPWTTLLDSLREQINAKQAVTPEEKRFCVK